MQVLEIFLAVPLNVRKSLRDKARLVHRLVEKLEETDRGLRHQEDEDEEADAKDDISEVSLANSVHSFASEATSTSTTANAYDVIFRRYTNMHRIEKKMAAAIEGGTLSKSERDSSQLKQPMKDASEHVSITVHAKQSQTNSGGESYPHEKVVLQDSVRVYDASKRGRESNPREETDKKSHKKHKMWNSASVIAGISRFRIFAAILFGYFLTLLIMTYQTNLAVLEAVHRLTLSSFSTPRITMAMIFALEHLFSNKAEAALANSLDPLPYVDGSYATAAIRELDLVRDDLSVLVSGGHAKVSKKNTDPEQDELLFYSLCDLDPNRFTEVYPEALSIYPQLFTACETTSGGILTRGLYATFMYVYDNVQTLVQPQYNKLLRYIMTGEASQGDPQLIAKAKSIFATTFDLFYNYVIVYFRYVSVNEANGGLRSYVVI